MSINTFIERTQTNPETVSFEETISAITEYYDYTPTQFSNGIGGDQVINAAGSNEGSCKIFAFAQLNNLTEEQTLACFGKFYREDVLENPEGTDHANIRTFMSHGWKGISFNGEALIAKN